MASGAQGGRARSNEGWGSSLWVCPLSGRSAGAGWPVLRQSLLAERDTQSRPRLCGQRPPLRARRAATAATATAAAAAAKGSRISSAASAASRRGASTQ